MAVTFGPSLLDEGSAVCDGAATVDENEVGECKVVGFVELAEDGRVEDADEPLDDDPVGDADVLAGVADADCANIEVSSVYMDTTSEVTPV